MVIKADHERIKTLLRDTITLLCRNGLSFKSEFSVEALIGITLDKEDVVLVSINEIVKSAAAELAANEKADSILLSDIEDESSDLSTNSHANSPKFIPSRKRKHSPSHSHHVQKSDRDNARDENKPNSAFHHDDTSYQGHDPKPRLEVARQDHKEIIRIKEEKEEDDWPEITHETSKTSPQMMGITNQEASEDRSYRQSQVLTNPTWPNESMYSQSTSHSLQQMPVSPIRRLSSNTVRQPDPSDSMNQMCSEELACGVTDDDEKDFGGKVILPETLNADEEDDDVKPANLNLHPTTSVQPNSLNSSDSEDAPLGHLPPNSVIGTLLAADSVRMPAPSSTVVNISRALPNQSGPGKPCPYCQKLLTSPRGYKLHIDAHRGIFPHNCTFCQRGFLSRTGLEGHVVQHTNKKLYTCTMCNKEFKYKHGLSYHHHVCPSRK